MNLLAKLFPRQIDLESARQMILAADVEPKTQQS
jgi:hypothetical protein